ncbi:MAG: TlpA disulfide reductase family protein [Cytophagales bacterium]|nr:TlpA disulfide reductase family protein [Cytophagales bacterium]
MKTSTILPLFILSLILFACNEQESNKQVPKSEEVGMQDPKVNTEEIQSDFRKWWTYHTTNIKLSSNFIGINEDLDTISKQLFLIKLVTENYIPLRVGSNEEIQTYQLFKLGNKADDSIKSTIKNVARTSLKYFEMEGMAFPEFEFTDLNGNTYTTASTKGKFLVVKTWFIRCKACILEFPELNEFVENYKERDDILFLSLATDSATELEKFISKRDFNYQVIPDQEDLIERKLGFSIYPIHLVIDKTGKVSKVVDKASTLISYMADEMELANNNIPTAPL